MHASSLLEPSRSRAMFFRRADFLAFGGCDPTLLVMEEADLCITAARAGQSRCTRRAASNMSVSRRKRENS
jgi:hypothetical protein